MRAVVCASVCVLGVYVCYEIVPMHLMTKHLCASNQTPNKQSALSMSTVVRNSVSVNFRPNNFFTHAHILKNNCHKTNVNYTDKKTYFNSMISVIKAKKVVLQF